MYYWGIEAGISDGFARRFAKELRAFKKVHRAEEEAAKMLTEQSGGFMR
jgi:hypothetical protein